MSTEWLFQVCVCFVFVNIVFEMLMSRLCYLTCCHSYFAETEESQRIRGRIFIYE